MTLPASTDFGIVGVKGERYELGSTCAAPGCDSEKEDAHHIFRRSALGTYSWVQMPDGRVVGNLTPLCRWHHDGVTGVVGGHRFWIKWMPGLGQYVWGRVLEGEPGFPEWESIGPLDPQPPVRESLDVSQPATEPEPDRCSTCGQRRRRAPALSAAGARRRRKSWLIKVPDDHEDGAAVLDTLVDDLSPLLGYEADKNTRYHTVAAVLVYAQQDKHSFARAIAGIGGRMED